MCDVATAELLPYPAWPKSRDLTAPHVEVVSAIHNGEGSPCRGKTRVELRVSGAREISIVPNWGKAEPRHFDLVVDNSGTAFFTTFGSFDAIEVRSITKDDSGASQLSATSAIVEVSLADWAELAGRARMSAASGSLAWLLATGAAVVLAFVLARTVL